MNNRISKSILLFILLIFSISTIPKSIGSLPYIFTNDEYYVVDQAMGYTTGNFSRSIGGIMYGYGDFPIIINSFGMLLHKSIYSLKLVISHINGDSKNVRKTGDELRNIYGDYQLAEENYYNSYFSHPSSSFMIARLFSLLFGICSLLVGYKISRLFMEYQWALIAVFFIALIPVFHAYASNAKVDMSLTFTSLSFLYYSILCIKNHNNNKSVFLCSLYFGLAMCSKMNGMFLLIPYVYIIATILRNRYRLNDNVRSVMLYALGGLSVAFVALGPNYLFNNLFLNIKTIAMVLVANYRSSMSYSGLSLITNVVGEHGIIQSVFIILGLLIVFLNKKYVKDIKILIMLYILAIFFPFIFFKTASFKASLYVLPALPIFAILSILAMRYIYYLSPYSVGKKNIVLFTMILVTAFPMAKSIKGEIGINVNSMNDTRIVAKQWIENNIPNNNKLFYLGRYIHLPPIRSKNRLAEDNRREEKFNQSLKIHFERFLTEIADSNYYYIEDYTGRYWREEEFEHVLSYDHYIDKQIDYVVYSPEYFERYNSEDLTNQKLVIDNLLRELNSKAVMVKEFDSELGGIHGPKILIFKLDNT
jgi:hypothetical protein